MTEKIKVSHLFKIFGPQPEEALKLAKEGVDKDEIYRQTGSVVAVNDVSFSVEEGEIFVVMGLSGSGKSTLIRCFNRLYEPTSGSVLLEDFDVTKASKKELQKVRLRRMGMVFQHFALLPHRTVAENAAFGLKVRGLSARERREKALEALETVGLDAWADSYPANLSGGMRQRVGLARALAVEPEVMLMDEPFSALDPLIRREMQEQLLEIQSRIKSTIVFITHDLGEALRLGTHIAIMKAGQIVQIGTPEEIVVEPAEQYVADFTEEVDRSRVLSFETVMEEPESVSQDTRAGDLAMREEVPGALGVYVVDKEGKPVGFLTMHALSEASDDTPVTDIMVDDFVQVRSDERLYDAFDRLDTPHLVAVVDEEGHLAGTVDPLGLYQHLEFQAEAPGDGEQQPEKAAQNE